MTLACVAPACSSVRPFTSSRQTRSTVQQAFPCRAPADLRRQRNTKARAGLEFDWSDPDTIIGAVGAFAGLALGIAVPAFYISRDEKDAERLEELREMNREYYKETGEYLTPDEIAKIRTPRWTDRREFQDDD